MAGSAAATRRPSQKISGHQGFGAPVRKSASARAAPPSFSSRTTPARASSPKPKPPRYAEPSSPTPSAQIGARRRVRSAVPPRPASGRCSPAGTRPRPRARPGLRRRTTRAESAAPTSTSRTQSPSPTRSCIRRGYGELVQERVVDREQVRLQRRLPVHVEQDRQSSRVADGPSASASITSTCAGRRAALELHVDAVERVAGRLAVELEHEHVLLAAALAPLRRIREVARLPPGVGAREHPWRRARGRGRRSRRSRPSTSSSGTRRRVARSSGGSRRAA